MPSVLDFNLDDVPELEVLPDNTEAKLRVAGASLDEGTSKNGRAYKRISVRYDVVGEPNAKTVFHAVWLPTEDSEEKQRIATLNQYRDFLQAHDLPTSGPIDVDTDLPGAEAWAILGVDDYEGEEVNRIKKFVKGA